MKLTFSRSFEEFIYAGSIERWLGSGSAGAQKSDDEAYNLEAHR